MSLKKFVVTVAAFAAIFAVTPRAFAATSADAALERAGTAPAPENVVTVGSETLTADEALEVLKMTSGGNPMLVGLMLTQTTLADRVEMARQMSDAMLFAEGAKTSGLSERGDIAAKIKWQRIQLLLEAYLQDISAKWDMSDKALRAYYDGHKEEFVQAPATRLRHILTNSEKDAKDALLDVYNGKDFAKSAEKFSRDTTTAPIGGDMGWMEKGMLPASVDAAIEGARPNRLIGPVQSDLGWHILEVTERRPGKQLSFDEARDEAVQRLQMDYVSKELASLREKIKVEINEKPLENIGGIPAAPAETTPEPQEEAQKPLDEKPTEEKP